nr:recombinase family protein [Herbaspirillum rubrisubalbicans]
MVGYARVSTEEQNLELQTQALRAKGCSRIYEDHGISGLSFSRPGLDAAIESLKPGGVLVVWRLDRLGRSLSHLTQLLDELGERQVGFYSITESMDTTSAGGRLIFHVMGALAEFERSLISERTRAGLAAARAVGKKLGRRPKLSQIQCEEAVALLEQGWSIPKIATQLEVHPRTLERTLRVCLKRNSETCNTAEICLCVQSELPEVPVDTDAR